MQLATIYTAVNPADAEIIRSRLEAADFHPIVTDGLSAFSSVAAGGILVQVPEDEANDAREFLSSSEETPPA